MHSPSILAALYLGLTDLFVTASGIVILLIVLSDTQAGRPSYWPADFELTCPVEEGGVWTLQRISDGSIDDYTDLKAVIQGLPAHQLHINLLIRSSPENLICIGRAQRVFAKHHGALGKRDGPGGPVLAVEWLPVVEPKE